MVQNVTVDEIIEGIIKREGGYVNDPNDPGGETNLGITWPTLKRAIALGIVPSDTTIRALTPPLAKKIYHHLFVVEPGFEKIEDPSLREQLVDFGVNSGPARAVQFLQRLLRVPVTGKLDGVTLSTLWKHDPFLVNEALAGARARFIDDLTDSSPRMRKFEEGLESRALEFVKSVPKKV